MNGVNTRILATQFHNILSKLIARALTGKKPSHAVKLTYRVNDVIERVRQSQPNVATSFVFLQPGDFMEIAAKLMGHASIIDHRLTVSYSIPDGAFIIRSPFVDVELPEIA